LNSEIESVFNAYFTPAEGIANQRAIKTCVGLAAFDGTSQFSAATVFRVPLKFFAT